MKKFILPTCFILAAFAGLAQQDAQYSLYQFNPLIINPAYAGAREGLSTVASIRNQWTGFGDFRTLCLSLHKPIMSKKVGLGLTVVNDKLGPRNMTGFYANAAYIAKLNSKFKLSFGLNAGFNQYQFNYSKITFSTTEGPVDLSQNNSHAVLDVNGGLYLKSNTFFAGLSISHLNAASVYNYDAVTSLSGNYAYNLRRHVFLTIGKSFILGENVIFAPTLLIKQTKTSGATDLNLNFFLYKKLWLGVFARSGFGSGFLLQYYINNKFRVGYSFDAGAKESRRLGGSNEVMLGFDFMGNKSKMVNPRFL